MNGKNANIGPDSGSGHEPPQEVSPGRLARLAWLPLPLLMAAIIAGRAAGLSQSYKAETLTLILSFAFYTLVSLGTIFLVGRSFLASGRPGLLLLECGVVLWSLAGTVGDAVSHGDANVNVTIFNTGILLAGLCHLTGSILSLRPQRALRPTPLWLGAGCALAIGGLWVVAWAALGNRLPVFFIPGQGGTLVRYFVLTSAIIMFAVSAGLLLSSQRAARAPFTYWYALALLLLAVGLFGVMIQLSLGCIVNWLGRTAQWLGGVYLLLAAIAALRESDLPLLPPEKKSGPALYRDVMAIVIVLATAAVRLTFLSALGTRAPYVVFFPAVMFAAIYGGWRSGLLATALSAIISGYFWIEPVGHFALAQPADWLGLAIFLLGGAMITWIAEGLTQARARASAAEAQSMLAAERLSAAEALRKSEERLRAQYQGSPIPTFTWQKKGETFELVDFNQGAQIATQGDANKYLGKTAAEMYQDRQEVLQDIHRCFTEKEVIKRELHSQHFMPGRTVITTYAFVPPDLVMVHTEDITERKQAEKALRESEERWATTLASIGDAVISTDVEGNITFMNTVAEELTGWKLSEASLVPVAEVFNIINEHTREQVESPIKRVLREGKVIGLANHTILMRKDGTEVPIDDSGAPIRDAEGKTVGVVLVFRDITERKRLEEDLNKRQIELQSLFNHSNAGLVLFDGKPPYTVLAHNKFYQELFAEPFKTQGMVGKSVYEYAPEVEAQGVVAVFDEVLRTKQAVNLLDFPYDSNPPEKSWFNWHLSPVIHDGEVVALASMSINVTNQHVVEQALRESKERYRNLFNTMEEGFCIIEMIFDAEGRPADYRFLEVNAAFEKQTGLHDAEGKLMRDLAPNHEAHWFEIYGKIALTGEPLHFENEARALNRWYEVYAYRVGRPEDRQVAIVFNDISGRKQAEEELRKAHDSLELRVQERTAELDQAYEALQAETAEREHTQEQLRQSQKMEALGTLTGGIAHDFNNILSAITGFAEMAFDDMPKESATTHSLQRVLQASSRGRDLIKQMLTFSRRTEAEKKPLRLSSLINETMKLIRASIPTTISIRVNLQHDLGLISADPTQIQQVLMNLCTNAAYAMREQGGVLDVELSECFLSDEKDDQLKPGSYLKLVVRDTGVGIPPEHTDKIFDPFFTTKQLGEGTGLGLSVVHGIVLQHEGHITVESEPGKGAVFSLYFPKIIEEASKEAVTDETVPRGKERILFIDDEEILVEMGQMVLERLGYEVVSVTTSKEALSFFRNDPAGFDLVITDQTMPEMTGVELSKAILAIRSDIPVILCTGFSHLVDADAAKEAGITAFAMKPMTKREIAKIIRKVLDE